jgi:hypothetical protein
MWYITQKRFKDEDIRYFNVHKEMFFFSIGEGSPFDHKVPAEILMNALNLKVEYAGEIRVEEVAPAPKEGFLQIDYPNLQEYMEKNAPFAKVSGVYDQRSSEFCLTLYKTSNIKNTRYTILEARGESLAVCFTLLEAFVVGLQAIQAP